MKKIVFSFHALNKIQILSKHQIFVDENLIMKIITKPDRIEKPVYVKMDVQGAELEVLKGFGEKIKEIDIVQIELAFEKFYESQFNYTEIFNFFYESGFNSFLQLDPKFNKNQLIYCDYLFIKS